MFRNKIVVTIFAVILLCCGLFLFYFSNINKTLHVDIYAENPLLIQNDNQLKDIKVNKYNDTAYTFLLPATFLYQTKTISFQNATNQNIQLAFYSEEKKDGEREIEFSLNVKDIQVNGQNIHKKKETVWYERPYIETVSVKKNETVSLTVTYKTKLMLRNFSVPQFVISNFLVICAIVLLLKCYFGCILITYSLKYLQMLICFLEKYGEWDCCIVQKYRDIDVVYKKIFWTVFIILNIVFLYYNIHFIWGNHDWGHVVNGLWGKANWTAGRFFAYLPNQLLGGRLIPLVTVSFALFGFSFTGILLAYYWNVPKTFFNYLILSLVIVLNPLVLFWMYFALDVVSHLWLPSIMILALILSEKKSLCYFFLAYFLFITGFGIYASGIATVATVFLGKIIITYCFQNHSIKFLYQKFNKTLFCIILSLITYKILITIMQITGVSRPDISSNQMNLFGGSLKQFFELIKSSYSYFFYSFPFYDKNLIWILNGISSFSLIVFFWYQKKYYVLKFSQFCFIAILMLLFPLALNTTEFILGERHPVARVLFFGYILFGAFFIALLLKTKIVWAKNILILFLIFLLPMNVYRLYDAQKLWKIEFEHEKNMMLEKILPLLQDSYQYVQKPYSIILFGRYKPLISFYYPDTNYSLNVDCTFMTSEGTLFFWGFPEFIKFHLPEIQIKNAGYFRRKSNIEFCPFWLKEGFVDPIQELLAYFDVLKNEMALWPHSKSILVKDNYLFINFDNEILQGVLKILEEKRKELNEPH